MFPFQDGVAREPGKLRQYFTRAERKQHNQTDLSRCVQLKAEQERDPDIQKWITSEYPNKFVKRKKLYHQKWMP